MPTISRSKQWQLPALALPFVSLTIYIGYFVERIDFQSYAIAYAAFFGLYIWACFFQKSISTKHLIALGIALRVLLLFSLPNLSDDFQRFLWDGRLTVAGYHPFLHPPSYFIENQILPRGISPELFHQLNSPNYFTVYPPVCQAVFAIAAWVAPENDWLAVLVMKLFLLACELGTLWLLGTAERRVLYALNPLMILEIVGNCHFEGAMVFFLVAGIVVLQQGKMAKSATLWAMATASKMLPLLFLPIMWRWLGWHKGLIFNMIFAAATFTLFIPLIAVLPNIAESLDLYFREFQFNGSIYYLVREVGYSKIGWDIGEFSGPGLAAATLIGILIIVLLTKKGNETSPSRLANAMLFAVFLYLSFSAVVQPWYVCVPFAISLFTRWRFALLWTGLVGLSYSHYDGGLRQENFALITLEYTVLWGFLLWEIWKAKPSGRGTKHVE